MLVIDCSLCVSHQLDCLRASGVDVIFRYYARAYQPEVPEKILKLSEATAICSKGMALAVVYQFHANRKESFNFDQGLFDSRYARKYAAENIKQPAGSSIYFGVDYDPKPGDIEHHIIPHFEGIAEGMSEENLYAKYDIGVYGGWNVCSALTDANLVKFRWLSQSKGYGGVKERKRYVDSRAWNLLQGMPRTDLCGLEHDRNVVEEGSPDFGQFML